MNQRKVLSWSTSIFLHSLVALALIQSTGVTINESQVEPVQSVEIGTFQAPKGEQLEVPEITKTIPKVAVEPPKIEKKTPVVAPKKVAQKVVPQKSTPKNDVQPAVLEEKSEVLADTSSEESEASPEEEAASEEPVAQAAEPSPAPPSVLPSLEKADGESEVAQKELPPKFGTPGSMIDEGKLIEQPGNSKPTYPFMARVRKQEGTVFIRAFIKKDGSVDVPILEKSSGHPVLDGEAIKTFSKWKYSPGLSGWYIKPFKFQLTN